MVGPDFHHYLITRFDVATDYGGRSHPGEAWLRRRIDLFDTFTLPSVRAQTTDEFTWLVFFAPDPPPFLARSIEEWDRWPTFVPCYVPAMNTGREAREAITANVGPGASHLITTRLDNDDAFCRGYLESVQSAFAGQDLVFVNCRSGVVLDTRRHVFSLVNRRANQFVSCIERFGDELTTVMATDHSALPSVASVIELDTPESWLHVEHGDNASNRPTGFELGIHMLEPAAFNTQFAIEWNQDRKVPLHG